MRPGPDARYVQHTHVVGTITYPSGRVGTLVFVKLGVPVDAPTDVLTFHKRHPTFPCDPTLNQLFTADRFDAYRALGEFAMHRAVVSARRGDGTLVAP